MSQVVKVRRCFIIYYDLYFVKEKKRMSIFSYQMRFFIYSLFILFFIYLGVKGGNTTENGSGGKREAGGGGYFLCHYELNVENIIE